MTPVTRTVWRITTRRFASQAFSGEGARLYGGRWNRVGQAVVYTAENRSLALLEMRVQDEPLRANYLLLPFHLPVTVSLETLDGNVLPKDWRTHAGREVLQSLGGEWLRQLRSCVLAVPSSVMPAELNFLINPLHPDFKHITLGDPEMLETDMRLR
jgi:RES domain-containing protein